MKKVSLTAIIILIAAILLAPYFIGSEAESKFREAYRKANFGPEVQFVVKAYNKGWFTSNARVELSLSTAVDPTLVEAFSIQLDHTIQHGPILFRADDLGLGILDVDVTAVLPESMTADFEGLNETINDILSVKARVGFDGAGSTVFILNGYDFTEDNATISLKPGKLKVFSTPEGVVRGNGTWQGVEITDEANFGMTLGSADLEFDLKTLNAEAYTATALFEGTSIATVEEIRISSKDVMGEFLLSALKMESLSTVNDDLLNIDLNMGAGQLNVMGMNFTDLIFDQTMSSLDVVTLQKLNELSQNMDQMNPSAEDMQQMQEVGMQFLAKKPIFKINNLGFTTPQGVISSQAKLGVDETLIDQNDPLSIVSALEMEMSGTIPVEFINNFGLMAFVNAYLEGGFVEQDAGMIKFDVEYKQGQMTLMDKPFTMPQ